MVDLEVISAHLQAMMLDGKLIYVRTEKEIMDFTSKSPVTLLIYTKTRKIAVTLIEELKSIVNLLMLTIFTPEKIVISWNIKTIVSYLKFNKLIKDGLSVTLYDLNLLESILGRSGGVPPESWQEAVIRVQAASKDKRLMSMHESIHRPLATRVVPSLETAGLVDKDRMRTVYSRYVIEGQPTGRLSTTVPNEKYFNPHQLDQHTKEKFITRSPNEFFVYFDYRNMEVSMLQWLSQDEELGKILKKDVYEEIYKVVTGILDEPAEQSRSTAKQFFLPVYYGLGATGLAESLGISFTAAQSIINSMKMNFNKSFEWIEDQQERAKTGVAVDYFGRTRAVGDDHYKARHFSVAAPAALVCMEKLIELHNLLPNNLIMSVHDGYYFAANRSNFGAIVRAVEGTLEAESKFCPGLRLKTKCTVGKSLSGMKEYERNRKVGSKVS